MLSDAGVVALAVACTVVSLDMAWSAWRADRYGLALFLALSALVFASLALNEAARLAGTRP